MLYLVLGLCEDTSSSCRKLITPFQFASQTCENFRISKLSGIGMQLTSTSQVGMGDLSWTFEHELFFIKTSAIRAGDWVSFHFPFKLVLYATFSRFNLVFQCSRRLNGQAKLHKNWWTYMNIFSRVTHRQNIYLSFELYIYRLFYKERCYVQTNKHTNEQ